MNIIRIAFAITFAALGIACIGFVPLSVSGTHTFATHMNNVFFQPKADAEVDRLIEKGLFTQEQESEIRGFVRRLYISDCSILFIGTGTVAIALGISLLSVAYSLKTSVQLSILSRRFEAEQAGAADRDRSPEKPQ